MHSGLVNIPEASALGEGEIRWINANKRHASVPVTLALSLSETLVRTSATAKSIQC